MLPLILNLSLTTCLQGPTVIQIGAPTISPAPATAPTQPAYTPAPLPPTADRPTHAPPPSAGQSIHAPPPAAPMPSAAEQPVYAPPAPAAQPLTAEQPVYGPPPPPPPADAVPPPAVAQPYPGPPPYTPDPPKHRFVFAFMPALTFGVGEYRLPSANAALFFGTRMRGDKVALGYQFTASLGFAERHFFFLPVHRHHFTMLANLGRRGFASMGAGLAFLAHYPAVAEFEARLGVRLGKRKRGLIGAQMRVGKDLLDTDRVPFPQLGMFIGISFL